MLVSCSQNLRTKTNWIKKFVHKIMNMFMKIKWLNQGSVNGKEIKNKPNSVLSDGEIGVILSNIEILKDAKEKKYKKKSEQHIGYPED